MSARDDVVTVLRSRTTTPVARGLHRDRLTVRLLGPRAPGLVLVAAPAGCGKTTLLTHAAARANRPAAWLTLDPALGSVHVFLAHLRLACAPLGVAGGPPWREIDEALDALEAVAGPGLLVLDELQSLDGSPAAPLVTHLLQHQPDTVRVLVGSRTTPAVVLARRLAGSVDVVLEDDLRFRAWEVEELFRQCHGMRMPAPEAAHLASRTGGWAAGLELFHLATRGRPPSVRARVLGAGSGPLSGDYLARHVLDEIPADLREFLRDTSVLSRLTGARCDALLGAQDGGAHLAAAHRLGLLTEAVDVDGLTYTCHDVMRSHLLGVLADVQGGTRARALHVRASQLAFEAAEFDDSLRASCRAQDWETARRILAVAGGDLADRPGAWIDMLPSVIRDTDPWVALALARRLVVEGDLDGAVEAYRRAASRPWTGTDSAAVDRELRMVQTWLNPPLGVVDDWVARARDAFVVPRRRPDRLRRDASPDPRRELAGAVADLVAGDLAAATRGFARVAQNVGDGPTLEALALLGEAVSLSWALRAEAAEARERAGAAAKSSGAPALERLVDGLELACRPGSDGAALAHLRSAARAGGDRWGAALLALFEAMGRLAGGRLRPSDVSALRADVAELAAPALLTWCDVLDAWVRTPVDSFETVVRDAAQVGPLAHAAAVAATGSTLDRTWALRLAASCDGARWLTLALRARDAAAGPVPERTVPRLEVRCLGEFLVLRDGVPTDLGALRPQHRAVLRALCVHAPAAVHRDRLVEWFWPDKDVERAQHSLQVAVSALRRILDRPGAPVSASYVRRVGAGYALVLDASDRHDARGLQETLHRGDSARARGDRAAAERALAEGIAQYRADLLPDDGGAEWVADERDGLRSAVLRSCEVLALLRAEGGDARGAVDAARQGLVIDRYRDELWQLLVDALEADGQPAAAAAAGRDYADVLAELDVPVSHRPGARSPARARA
ncbi:BTAD domain-containing putative transcriptional regulator [Cellulomonas sp. URHD0024]|uniref:BTAD domain-containing putative transcriptional regulator n=1 Tax=Cellulomonas sp. URHD0024 TaxID=1302620 RepID=UPI0004204D6B|nr:BTAD domain-containing putative transcriptional regulator [Cellulomonas sp. URHD0024]